MQEKLLDQPHSENSKAVLFLCLLRRALPGDAGLLWLLGPQESVELSAGPT